MKYLFLKLNDEKYWFELEEDNYANRQIVLAVERQMLIPRDCVVASKYNIHWLNIYPRVCCKKQHAFFLYICVNKLLWNGN